MTTHGVVLASAGTDLLFEHLSLLIPAVAAAVVSIITAFRQGGTNRRVDALHQEMRPPSNGKTAGTLLENTAYALHAMASIYAKEHGVDPLPPITQVGPLPERRQPPDPPAAT